MHGDNPDIPRNAFYSLRQEMDEASMISKLTRYFFSRDLAAIVGVTIGAVAMVSPWLVVGGFYLGINHPGFQVIPTAGGRDWQTGLSWGPHSFFELIWADSPFRVPLLVFLVGTVIAAFTRIGGLIQALGLTGFVTAAQPAYISAPSLLPSIPPSMYHTSYYVFMIGYLLAVVSTLVVMFGGRRFTWNSRNYGNVPATGRMTAFLPHATRIMR